MDKEFFNQGETMEEFVNSLGDVRPKFEQHMNETELDQKQIQSLPAELKVVVIAEEWSGDVLYNVPVLFKIAKQTDWDVRVFRRDEHPELIEPYKKDGIYQSIPVFVFYDQEFNEITHWVERPAEATRVIDEESLKLRRKLREDHKDEWREATKQEIIEDVQS